MEHFVNEYKHTADIASESMAVWWRRKFRKGYISMGICILVVLGVFLLSRRPTDLLLGLLPILVIVLFKVKEKRAVKLQLERMEVINKDVVPAVRVEIGEDICVSSDNREIRVSFSDVENMVVTDNLIVLFIKGNMAATLDKKGFTSGNADECINYLIEHI